MLIDLRIYTFHPGKLGEFLKLAQSQILPLQSKYCGNCIFYSVTETGTLNQVIQAWARVGTPSDVAQAVMLCVNNSFITGTIIDCDGGRKIV